MINTLAELFKTRGVPRCIRSDNGPEFISQAIRAWLDRLGIEILYIAPGSPWENGYVESFHSKFRDEFLDRELFENLKATQAQTANWRHDYNHHRPHSSLNYQTPAEFAARCGASAPKRAPAAPPPASPLQPHQRASRAPPNPYHPTSHSPWYRIWGQATPGGRSGAAIGTPCWLVPKCRVMATREQAVEVSRW